jgi:hypothetical protein
MTQQIWLNRLSGSWFLMVLLAMMAVRMRIAFNRNPIFDHQGVGWPICRVDPMPERQHHMA